MGKNELFIKRVYDIITELKIPLIDERVYDKAKFSSKNTTGQIIFTFEEDESVIRGFLGLADYFHTVVIKEKEKFFIPTDSTLYILECK